MGWFFNERGPGWKQGWIQRTVTSISAPPLPLIFIFGIICLLLSVSSYMKCKKEIHRTVVNLKLFMLFLPVVLIFAAQFASKCESLVISYSRTKRVWEYRSRNLPWGMVVLVALLLVMLSYQSYFHSMWSPNIWRSDY